MKIAILSHFGTWNSGYALHIGWLERARILQYFDQDFDFLVNDTCSTDIFPNTKKVLSRISSDLPFEERVDFFEKNYLEVLPGYDIVLTADLIYQRKNNFLAQNQAMRNAARKLCCRWFHWIHSSWTSLDSKAEYPEILRFTTMPNSTIVYMNWVDIPRVAEMYNVAPRDIACVHNPKDIRSFDNFDDMSWKISKELHLMEKDFVQIFPFCSTRLLSKGVLGIIQVFAALKRNGSKVAVVFVNNHANRALNDIDNAKAYAEELGLIEGEDFIFTHTLTDDAAPLSRKVVSDLFSLSNLFVFASFSEVCSNVLLEAKIKGCLLVLSQDVPSIREFGGSEALYCPFTYTRAGELMQVNYHNEELFFDKLTNEIKRKYDVSSTKTRFKAIQKFSWEGIWFNQMRPLLYGGD